MPLIRHTPALVPTERVVETATPAPAVEKANKVPPDIYTGRKNAPMSKEDYWKGREERDIQNGKCIRLSGVLQALLESVNFGQYCTGTTPEEYLVKVEEASLRLAKFITEKAE